MAENIKKHIEEIFSHTDISDDLKEEIIANLLEKYNDLIAAGFEKDVAYKRTIESIGDISEFGVEKDPMVITKHNISFTGRILRDADLLGEKIAGITFRASDMAKSNLSRALIEHSTFSASNVSQSKFDGAKIDNCDFKASNLSFCSFKNAKLTDTRFKTSNLEGSTFVNVKFSDCEFKATNLKNVVFENCTFYNVTFTTTDLTKTSLENQVLVGVKFRNSSVQNVSFKGSTIKNSSIFGRLPIFKTKSYIKSVNFDGAKMDKLTYAYLKGLGANLTNIELL